MCIMYLVITQLHITRLLCGVSKLGTGTSPYWGGVGEVDTENLAD